MDQRIEQLPYVSAILLLIVLWSPVAPAANTEESLSVNDALQMNSFMPYSAVALSPDGAQLAYVVLANREMRSFDRKRLFQTGVAFARTDIVLVDTNTGGARVLTGENYANWGPVWSPDGRYLAFLSDRDGGQARLWLWTKASETLKEVSETPVRGDEIEWAPDGQKLIFTTLPTGFTVESYLRTLVGDPSTERQAQTDHANDTVVLYAAQAAKSNAEATSDPWNLDLFLRDLREVDAATGQTRTLVEAQRIAAFHISSNGREVAYTRALRFEKPGSQQTLFDLLLTNLENGSSQVLAGSIRLDYDGSEFSWSPDGSTVAFHEGGTEDRNFDGFVIDHRTGVMRNVTSFPPSLHSRYKSSVPLWDQQGHLYLLRDGELWRASADEPAAVKPLGIDGQEIRGLISLQSNRLLLLDRRSTLVITSDAAKAHDTIYRIDLLRGTTQPVLGGDRCYTCELQEKFAIASSDGQRIVYFAEDAQHPSDLWIAKPDFSDPRRLTHLNPQLDRHAMGTATLVDWLSLDGARLHGTLLLPPNYAKNHRYPLIVWVYGGASLSQSVTHFGTAGTGPFNMQLFATRGYAVFLPDAPQQLGSPMVDLGKTVLPGVNRIIEMGIADPDRIGLMGRSYGGYSTLALIAQTKRFKAAIDIDGYGSMLSAYGQMDSDGTAFLQSTSEEGQGLMGGTPWEFRDRYIENSPIFYFDRVDTPLLIIHGSSDDAVESFLGDEVFVALRRLGKQVEYAKYAGEGHDPAAWRYSNQVDFSNRIIDWFDKWLRRATD